MGLPGFEHAFLEMIGFRPSEKFVGRCLLGANEDVLGRNGNLEVVALLLHNAHVGLDFLGMGCDGPLNGLQQTRNDSVLGRFAISAGGTLMLLRCGLWRR